MGSFMGHVVPGTFFISFGIYWMVRVFDRLFRHRHRRGGGGPSQFSSSASFACKSCCCIKQQCNQEAVLKLVAVAIGITGEIITGFEDGEFKHMGNAQHATMFFAFGLTGVADLLLFYKAPFAVRGMDYAAAFLALVVEGVLFGFHLHGFNALETHVHVLLIYVIFANAVAVLLEMKDTKSPMAALARCYCFLLQGTWFWQVAFILYNPLPGHAWDGNGHESLMFSTLYFSWHLLGNLVVTIFVAMLVYCYNRQYGGKDMAYAALLERPSQAKADATAGDAEDSDDQTQA